MDALSPIGRCIDECAVKIHLMALWTELASALVAESDPCPGLSQEVRTYLMGRDTITANSDEILQTRAELEGLELGQVEWISDLMSYVRGSR